KDDRRRKRADPQHRNHGSKAMDEYKLVGAAQERSNGGDLTPAGEAGETPLICRREHRACITCKRSVEWICRHGARPDLSAPIGRLYLAELDRILVQRPMPRLREMQNVDVVGDVADRGEEHAEASIHGVDVPPRHRRFSCSYDERSHLDEFLWINQTCARPA